jgi:integrase
MPDQNPDKPTRPKPLNEKAIAKLAPRERRYFVFDPAFPAFAVRVFPSGVKTYVLYYRKGIRLRMATLGRVGKNGITLDQARRDARGMVGLVSKGEDPQAAKDAARGASTVKAAFETWLAEHVEVRRKPSTLRLYKLAQGHVNTTLGGIPVDQLTTADTARLHGRLRSTPYLANRTLAALSSFLTWCERQGSRPQGHNPCRGIEKFPEQGHDRYLTADEYARLGQAIRDAERSGAVPRVPLTAIRLLLLTGCRPAEILTLEWSAVDLKAAVLRLPDSKTGERTIQLPPDAVRLLKRWPVHLGSSFVFPGTGHQNRRGEHLVNLAKPWERLRKAAKIEDVRLYDACRHSFASVAISKHGHALSVVGELLGHSQAATTKRYTHLHDEAARSAVKQIGGSIAAALKRKVTAS